MAKYTHRLAPLTPAQLSLLCHGAQFAASCSFPVANQVYEDFYILVNLRQIGARFASCRCTLELWEETRNKLAGNHRYSLFAGTRVWVKAMYAVDGVTSRTLEATIDNLTNQFRKGL